MLRRSSASKQLRSAPLSPAASSESIGWAVLPEATCDTAPAPSHGCATGQSCWGGLHHNQHFLTAPTNSSSQHCQENKPASGSTGTSLHGLLTQSFLQPPNGSDHRNTHRVTLLRADEQELSAGAELLWVQGNHGDPPAPHPYHH